MPIETKFLHLKIQHSRTTARSGGPHPAAFNKAPAREAGASERTNRHTHHSGG